MNNSQATVERIEDQIAWYDKKSLDNQARYKYLKVAEIVAAAFIPLLTGFLDKSTGFLDMQFLIGLLGVLIVVLEGLQHLNQYQQNWITYRSTCESLKHEKFLWLAKAGHYVDADNPNALFAERVESLISQEHAKWVTTREQAAKETTKS